MGIGRQVRRLIPARWEPPARYMYERARGLLERELALAARAIRRGDRAIDVGANVGIYTHVLARRGARVEAFEPQATCAATLRAYAAGRDVHVHEVALGRTPGRATLHIPIHEGRRLTGYASFQEQGGGASESVRVATLDEYGFDDVALVKIDVEGAELDVIVGGEATLRRNKPLLLVEVERRHHREPIGRVFAHLDALGFDGSFLDLSGHLRPLAEFDPARHQAGEPGRENGYVNNFLFAHREGDRRWLAV